MLKFHIIFIQLCFIPYESRLDMPPINSISFDPRPYWIYKALIWIEDLWLLKIHLLKPQCNLYLEVRSLRELGLDVIMKVGPPDAISALIKRGRETRASTLSATWAHSKRASICKPGRGLSPGWESAATQPSTFQPLNCEK